MKLVAFEQNAREAIKRGVSILARTVRTTLGPRGRNVMILKTDGPPLITKDGVTVAKEIELEDKYENVGAQMVREVASKTSDVAGDGTTTATVLADAIFNEGLKVATAGANPVELTSGMQKCVDDITRKLNAWSIPIKGQKEMAQVASIAANNDTQIGDCIADSLKKVGKDGVVTIEEGKSLNTTVEWVQGLGFDKGYLSPYFVTNVEKMECELVEPYILIHEKKLSNLRELLPLLELIASSRKPLLIIAEDVEGEALTTLVINHLRGTFQICAVKAPGYGDRRKAILEDLGIVTGGMPILENLGVQLENLTLNDLGRAKRVVIDKETTVIIEGGGKKDAIKLRIAQLNHELETSASDFDREQLQTRKAKLSGGVAKISVGGATESEVKQKMMRFEDALNATRAAVEEGVLPGGGVALLRAADACTPVGLTHDQAAGYNIIRRACRSPLFWIASNAGQPGNVVVERVREGKDHFGYNAATNAYDDLVKSGILDATKVVRTALKNASSVSTLLLTSGAVIAESFHNGESQS